MPSKPHWEQVYATKASDGVSWYQAHAETSLSLIHATGVPSSAGIIDVGGGASTLVDDLLARGYRALTVLDLSGAALGVSRARLGSAADQVRWLEGDITRVALPAQAYELWHDRAVFHFLTDAADRAAYITQVQHALQPGGHLIVATFAEDGPTQCSGLPVARYSAEALQAEFGTAFELIEHRHEDHRTPFGTTQKFVFCRFRRASA
jgi:SAM-dependent methyltransferase